MNATLSRYIARRVLSGIMLAFLVIISIIMLVDFVEISRNFDDSQAATLPVKLGLTVLNAPRLIEQTIPFVVLFGVMGAFYALNRRAELIIMRAAGRSIWWFLRPALFVTMGLGIIWSIAFNPLSRFTTKQYEALAIKATGASASAPGKEIWLRDGNIDQQVVIHARDVEPSAAKIIGATFYDFEIGPDRRPAFVARYDAETAVLMPNGYWVLSNVIENQDGKAPRSFKSISKPTTLALQNLYETKQSAGAPPVWEIPKEIEKMDVAGLDTTPMLVSFHRLIALPVLLGAMTVLAACVTMRLSREGSALRLLIFGGLVGFAVFFSDNIIGAFGETGSVPPLLAAWAMPLLLLFLGTAYLTRIEDG